MTKTNDGILSVTVSSLTEVVDVDEIHHPKHNDCCPSWIGVAERVELVACPTGPRKKKVRKQATVRTQEGSDDLCPWWVVVASALVHGLSTVIILLLFSPFSRTEASEPSM